MDDAMELPESMANWDEESLDWQRQRDAEMMDADPGSMDEMPDDSLDTAADLPNSYRAFEGSMPTAPIGLPEASPRKTNKKSRRPYKYVKRNMSDYDFARDWLGTTFIRVPTPVLQDDRLNHTDIAVLIALASFANSLDGRCMPSREEIAKRVGISTHNISRATTRLNDYGWLSKKQRDKKSPVYYYLHIPPQFLTEDCLRKRPDAANPPDLTDEEIWRDGY